VGVQCRRGGRRCLAGRGSRSRAEAQKAQGSVQKEHPAQCSAVRCLPESTTAGRCWPLLATAVGGQSRTRARPVRRFGSGNSYVITRGTKGLFASLARLQLLCTQRRHLASEDLARTCPAAAC
jgi:hypothetical protein